MTLTAAVLLSCKAKSRPFQAIARLSTIEQAVLVSYKNSWEGNCPNVWSKESNMLRTGLEEEEIKLTIMMIRLRQGKKADVVNVSGV